MSSKRAWFIVLFVSILVLTLGADPRSAAIANTLSSAATPLRSTVEASTRPYSGRLSNEAGQPVADGAYDMRFALYDALEGGNLLWSETQTGVAVRGGSFTCQLGSVSPLPAATRQGKQWLAVAVRGPEETGFTALNPRQPFSAPLAGVSLWAAAWRRVGVPATCRRPLMDGLHPATC